MDEIKEFIKIHFDEIQRKDHKIKTPEEAYTILLQISLFHIKDHPKIFDWKRYINTFPDLRKNLNTSKDAVWHYLNYGIRERRKVYVLNSNEIYEHQFNWKDYVTINQDLRFLLTDIDCFEHYITQGYLQNRKTTLKEQTVLNDRIEISDNPSTNKNWLQLLTKYLLHLSKPTQSINISKPTQSINISKPTQSINISKPNQSINISKPNQSVLVCSHSNLAYTAGDTIMLSNWINKFMSERNFVTIVSKYTIPKSFLINLQYKDFEIKTFEENNKIINYMDKNIENFKTMFIRNHELLDMLQNKSYLNKIIFYGLDPHINGLSKMNNKFKKVITQSAILKTKMIKKKIEESKIEVQEPLVFKYNFKIPPRNDKQIRLIYCGTLRDEENILEIIEEFKKIHAKRPEVVLKIVYGKIFNSSKDFTNKINNYIKQGVKGITFKHNLTHRESCYEIATSDIGICWRKNGWGENGEVSTKVKEYELYGLMIINSYLMNLKNINISIFSTVPHILDGSSLFTKIYNKYISNISVGYINDNFNKSLYHHYNYDIILDPANKNKQHLFIKFIIILSTLKDIYVIERGHTKNIENNFSLFHEIASYSKIFYYYDINHLITPDTYSKYANKIKNLTIVHQNSQENHDKFKSIYPAFYKCDYLNNRVQPSNKDIIIGVFGSIVGSFHYEQLLHILIKIAKKNKSFKIIFIYGKIARVMNSGTIRKNLEVLKSLPNVEFLHNIPHEKMKLYYDKITLGIFTKKNIIQRINSIECLQISSRFIDYIYNNIPFIFYNHSNVEKKWIDKNYPLSINEITYENIMDKIMYYKKNNVVLKDYIKPDFYYTYSIDNMIDTFKH